MSEGALQDSDGGEAIPWGRILAASLFYYSVIRLGVLEPGVPFLAKPYSARKRLDAVATALENK
jgi:hypothetical protein